MTEQEIWDANDLAAEQAEEWAYNVLRSWLEDRE